MRFLAVFAIVVLICFAEAQKGGKGKGKTSGGRPQGGRPSVSKPQGGRPSVSKPQGGRPSVSKPQGGRPSVSKPQGGRPSVSKPQGGRPSGSKPQGGRPSGSKPQGGRPSGSKPQGGKPSGGKPQGGKPSGGKPSGGTGGKPDGKGDEEDIEMTSSLAERNITEVEPNPDDVEEEDASLAICGDILNEILDQMTSSIADQEEFVETQEDGAMENMCEDMDPMLIGAFCVAGTDMGAKMEVAIAECYNKPTEAAGRAGKAGKGKGGKGGKGGKCPSYDDIISKINSETADEQCFMKKMGWVDSNYNFLDTVQLADMASLNSTLTDRIDLQELDECASKMVKKMGTETEECHDSYTEEEADTLKMIGQAIAYSTCGHKMFEKACGAYAKESFIQFMTDVVGATQTVGK